MAITYVGAASAESNNVALPTHQAGDLILIYAARAGTTSLPTVPSGWTGTRSATNASGSVIVGFKIATSGSEVSGTWTNADSIAAVVYRSDSGKYVVPGAASTLQSTSTTISYNVVNSHLVVNGNTSWFVGMVWTNANQAGNTAPSGMTNRTSAAGTYEIAIHDTNSQQATWTTNTVATTSVFWRTYVVEVWETEIAIASGSGGGRLIGPSGLIG
jgi:hypothetical protein